MLDLIIDNYLYAMDQGPTVAKDLLIKKRHFIIENCGKNLYKELILNYRTYYNTHNKDKLLADFDRLILNKSTHHTSDLAIAYNILMHVRINDQEDQKLIEFIYARIKDHLPTSMQTSAFNSPVAYKIKRKMLLDWVDNYLEDLKDLRSQPEPI